ncbi:hypothetical protein BHE90_013089 [Fusarium euwallaceae]|uniref:Aromatic prenyltransferase (DMATS family) n=4 Tax=Fusarium solani species complex TaxID=232080 RepID=A0A3M2RE19_9HYPO|nr:hypothetical protein CDV36_014928 [Fusarium kuroshium]RSL61673.1 hypothetical protein CEP51_013596 [Fusarium floridanum]RSL92235.1 hypothetical protein CDV31_015243 [Fusarium ambrosium]RTE72500.1 hypothetical protein BHE90_013089 [Fusarium euwallaceae]
MAPSSSFPDRVKAWPLAKATTQGIVDPHQQYWYLTVGHALTTFLVSAGYGHEDQVNFLYHFAKMVIPYLGVSPISGLPRWKSFMTDNHTPIELSWDFHTGTEQPTIRYSIEPVGLNAGTPEDPNNDRASVDFKQSLTQAFPNIDSTLFNHFQAFFSSRRCAKSSPERHSSTMFWAFDLKKGEIMNKVYFFPGAVAYTTNQSELAVISDAIRSAPGWRSQNLGCFETFVDYMNQHSDLRLEIDMMALDLVPSESSRLKVYFRDRRTNFQAVRDTMSLGGRVACPSPDFEEGMHKLRQLWNALLGTANVTDDTSLPYKGHRTAGVLYNVEFRRHKEMPNVKIYIPVRHYAKDDQHIARTLTAFLCDEANQQQDCRNARACEKHYMECLRNTFGLEALTGSLGLHTYIGCSIQPGGKLRVVSYVNPNPACGV